MSLNIGNPIKYFARMSNEHNQIKEFMCAHNEYLQQGNYKVINLGKTIVYTNSRDNKEFLKKQAEEYSGLLGQFKLFTKRLLANFLRIKTPNDGKKTTGQLGELILFTMGGEKKIFDFTNEIVLHLFNNPDEYRRMKSVYKTFQPFFKIPVEDYFDYALIIKESYITSDASRGWSDNTKELILEDYCRCFTTYLENCILQEEYCQLSTEDLLDTLPQSILNTSLGQMVRSMLVKNEMKEWQVVQCHGDLWSRNVLIDSNSVYIIDWEDSNKYLFFHDLLHCIGMELLCQNDDLLFYNYFDGKYDALLTKMFSAMGTEYREEYRKAYMGLSILQKIASFNYNLEKDHALRWFKLGDLVMKQYG